MGNDEDVLRQAASWLEGGAAVALATVAGTWGSAPRPVGSHLAVDPLGQVVGSVSGGCVEAAVVREALDCLHDGKARLLSYGVTHERAWELGLPCGGRIEVLVARLDSRASVDEILASTAARRAAVVAMDLRTGVSRVLPLLPDQPAGVEVDVAEALLAEAREAVRRGESRRVEGPDGPLLLRTYVPAVQLIVVGAVHIAQALAVMAAQLGFQVIVVDPRRAFATAARFPGVALRTEWPEEALAAIGLGPRSAVVTVTHDPKIDEPALAAALRSDAFYVGALGSRRSQAARRERLLQLGFGQADLARIHGPVGLAIGAVSPGEIAISVLAEIVATLRAPPAATPALKPV